MIEVDFKDRLPKYPGRVKMTPVPGQMDVFEMVRMDEPTEHGTPLDKATFDSIIKSRLTGRYYEPTVTPVTVTSASGTTNPIPTSWNNSTESKADSGSYSLSASGSRTTSSYPYRAFDGNTSTYWMSSTGTTAWIQLNVPEGLIVNKMKISFVQSESWSTTTTLQALNSSGTWITLIGNIDLPSSNTLKEYTISNPSTYRSYRLVFSTNESTEITLYEWQISSWSTAAYRMDYTITSGMPATWNKGQRITLSVPNYTIAGITGNTFNGKTIRTVLLPNRKYELIYNGSTFDAKEV